MRNPKLRLLSVASLMLSVLLMLSACAPSDYVETTVQTPKGTTVDAWRVTAERAQTELDEADAAVALYHPNAVIVRNSTQYYNCHSYAWYSTSISNDIWIDNPNQSAYWSDGSYLYVGAGNHSTSGTVPAGAAVYGYRVRYINDDHSARVYGSTGYIAKWGYGPLVRHSPNDSPYDNSRMHYYKAE